MTLRRHLQLLVHAALLAGVLGAATCAGGTSSGVVRTTPPASLPPRTSPDDRPVDTPAPPAQGEPPAAPAPPEHDRTVADGIALTLDVPFTEADGLTLTLDVVQPDPLPAEKVPAIIFFHGGGWRAGDKRKGHDMLRALARAGYIGFSVNYRLSAAAEYPAPLHDCKAAVRWVRLNGADWGADGHRIGVTGTSAGGHLAALLATTGDVPELSGELAPQGPASAVQACVDWYGPADLRRSDYNATVPHGMVEQLLGGTPEERPGLARLASPAALASAGDAPTLIIHGTRDETVPVEQSHRLYDALRAAGAETELIEVPEGRHGNFKTTEPSARELERRMREWFDAHLK